MNTNQIIKLSDREHILRRPSMYIGGISEDPLIDYFLTDGCLVPKELKYPPGFVKIINEVLDNSIDAILKTGVGDTISIDIDTTSSLITVGDNSSGFPNKVSPKDEEPVVLALGNARAGSNFDDESNIGQMGTNGVGAFATNCFSKEFRAVSTNKEFKVSAIWTDNAIFKEVKSQAIKNSKTGTKVSFLPDLEKFGIKEITPDIITAVKTRVLCLAYTYPKMKFIFNKEQMVPSSSITDLMQIGDDPVVHYATENYEVHVIARSETCNNFSFINGLNIRDGGTHLDVIANDLSKEFSTMRGISASKGDITNTLQLVFVGTKFKNLRFNSQTKEKITNSTPEVRNYLGDLGPLIKKVTKSKEIRDFIKATSQARELRADKSKLKQAKRAKIKSDKFLDAQDKRRYLLLVEGDSAQGGLLPTLGRKEIAYYKLMGKPLNAWSSTMQKMTSNRELSEVLNIVHNSDFEKVIFGTDQDLDGFHIRGLLLGFFAKYLPEMQDKIYFLQTPVRGVMNKAGDIDRWSFNLKDDLKLKSTEHVHYFKGLGSWSDADLRKVIEVEGLDAMMQKVQLDLDNTKDVDILDAWLGSNSQLRKDLILENDFNIAKI